MPKYEVEVTRIDYASKTIEVDADNPEEAKLRAREVAGDYVYDHTGHTEEYEIDSVLLKLSEADQKVVEVGRGLLDGCTPDGGQNPEYTRAILELVYDLTTLNKGEAAEQLGLLMDALYKRCTVGEPTGTG